MARMRKTVTLRWLRQQDACRTGLHWFKDKFGATGSPSPLVLANAIWKNGKEHWIGWMFKHVLPPELFAQWAKADDQLCGRYGLGQPKKLAAAERRLDYRYLKLAMKETS